MSLLQALLGSMSDQYGVYPTASRSYGRNPMEDPFAEEMYKASLKQWLEDNKTDLIRGDSHKLAEAWKALAPVLNSVPNLSDETRAGIHMANQLGQLELSTESGLQSQLETYKNSQGSLARGGEPTSDIKNYRMSQQDPGLSEFMKFQSTQPTNAEKYADALGLQGEDRRQFIFAQANKQNGSVVNVNTGNPQQPQVNILPPEVKRNLGLPENTQYVVDKNGMPQAINPGNTDANKIKQHFDTMSNASKRLDALATQVPDYNPAEFSDAMIRSLASDDSSLVGKVLSPLQSPASKAYGTAAAEWVSSNRAILSGAEVPETEFMRDLSIYFAKPGDTKEILAMKAQMRRDRVESLKSIAALPPDQRAAAWKATGDSDGLKLSGLSTESPVIGATNAASDKVTEVVKAWEQHAGRPATPDEVAKIKAKLGVAQ